MNSKNKEFELLKFKLERLEKTIQKLKSLLLLLIIIIFCGTIFMSQTIQNKKVIKTQKLLLQNSKGKTLAKLYIAKGYGKHFPKLEFYNSKGKKT